MTLDFTPLINKTMTVEEWAEWVLPKPIIMTPEYKQYMDHMLAISRLPFWRRLFISIPKFTGQRFTRG